MVSKLTEIWFGLFIPDPDPDFLLIQDTGPQHCFELSKAFHAKFAKQKTTAYLVLCREICGPDQQTFLCPDNEWFFRIRIQIHGIQS